jgi:hypothetical protein
MTTPLPKKLTLTCAVGPRRVLTPHDLLVLDLLKTCALLAFEKLRPPRHPIPLNKISQADWSSPAFERSDIRSTSSPSFKKKHWWVPGEEDKGITARVCSVLQPAGAVQGKLRRIANKISYGSAE